MADTSNAAIAEILRQIGEYLDMQKVPFKPRAYEKAAQVIDALEEELAETYKIGGKKALLEVPGIGMSMAGAIEELIKTGKIKQYEELKKSTPVRLDQLAKVEGLGPKSIQKLYQELGVKNLADLEKAAKAGKIAKLEGFGKKSEEKILKNIGFAEQSGQRFITGYMLPRIRSIVARLEKVSGVKKVTPAGSARRRKETIGDVDILVVADSEKSTQDVMKAFVSMADVINIIAEGPTKSSVKLRAGINVDLRVVPAESYGAALNYFTGSKEHNVALRRIAVEKNWKLSEWGLFKIKGGRGPASVGTTSRGSKDEIMIAGKTEEEVYAKFGMDYIEPELRENTGEIEAALAHTLPKLIGYGDLQGDLQIQTDWTDGSASIEAMALAAYQKGLKYIVITDHTKRLAMTHGLDEKRLLQQMAEIDRVNKKLAGKIKVLKGTECDILKDGSLDLPDDLLAKLDVVGVSVHSYFNLPRAEQTARVLRAIDNPNVDIFFHPTGRLINKRPPIDIDIDAVIDLAKKTKTVMEVNSFPERSDLKDEHVRKCVELGVKLSIDSDAHAIAHYALLENGIAVARRGWAEKKDVINAWPVEKMVNCLKGAKK
ncbi:MAG TPA: DNA polymerase/3'-5' exonuclease PolX [Candidatus Paceibacterota bacterium]|nr:DNA polymerase/3'-5' exonuclease PolX [Candidatus Paceibacterota bacterium]